MYGMNKFKKLVIIMPAFNEEQVIQNVIKNLESVGFKNILVVDDGSKDKTVKEAKKTGVVVLTHLVNIGLGGALSTGLTYAKLKNYKYAITVDSDGQHNINDVEKIATELLKNKYDFVIGSRLKDMQSTNKMRYIGNHLLDIFTFLLSRKYVEDSQSGLRGFNKKALDKIVIDSTGYEVSSEIIVKAVKAKIKIKTISIDAIYSNYTLKKGQKISNVFRLVRKLLW